MSANPTDQELKYSFLKVRKEKESILLGINPTNKYQHELLKIIRSLNTIQNAGKGMLFTLKNAYLEQLQIDNKTATTNLNQMVGNLLVAQIPVLEYDVFNKTLNAINYFLTHPAEEKSYSIYNVFDELIAYSFNSVKAWYEDREPLTSEEFFKELAWQNNPKNTEEFKGISGLFSPLKKLYSAKNGISTSQDMIDYIAKEVTSRILEMNMGIDLPGHGIFLFKPGEILEIYETSEEFLHEKILPELLEDVNYKFRIEPFLFEKKTFLALEKFPRKTARFTANLARETKTIKAQSQKNPNHFPGSLCLEILSKLEPLAEEKYSGKWREECDRIKRDFKKTITTSSNKWQNLIEFISHEDSLKYHPDIWRDLVNDTDLFYGKWQIPKMTVHVFTGKDVGFIKTLVLGMMNLPDHEIWKAQALKSLIEKNEKRIRALLVDPKFTVVYNELIRKIYIQYIPWYFRIFLYFPLSVFMDTFIDDAKKKILEEQENLTKKNDAINSKLQAEYNKSLIDEQEKLKDQMMSESLTSTLDSFYFQQKRLPILEDIRQFYTDEVRFNKIIKKHNFRVLKISVKGVDDTEVLLYPTGGDWSEKKTSLLKTLESIVTEKNPHISVNYDKAKYERAQKLIELIQK
jgi:hypothetical protein